MKVSKILCMSLCLCTEIFCASAAILPGLTESKNDRCGSAFKTYCPKGKCCSKYGWCSNSDNYCSVSKGCQVGYGICNGNSVSKSQTKATTTSKKAKPTTNLPISKDGRCGSTTGTRCPNNECCSKYGYCGVKNDHCAISNGCQSKYGLCKGNSNEPIKTTTTTKNRKPTTTTKAKKPTTTSKPTTNLPISKDGRCGSTVGTKCPNGECCSKYGYCGVETNHCSISNGCQSKYGLCMGNSTKPKKPTTTTKNRKPTTTTKDKKPTTTTKPATNLPISKDGRCGSAFGTKCANEYCCSKDGWCGNSKLHCSINSGCQSKFGKCN